MLTDGDVPRAAAREGAAADAALRGEAASDVEVGKEHVELHVQGIGSQLGPATQRARGTCVVVCGGRAGHDGA